MPINLYSVGARGLTHLYTREPRLVIRNIRKLWHFYLKNLIPDIWFKGNSEYIRFIMVSRPRTGSNLVRGSLMSHSQIVVLGDLFRRYKPDRSNLTIHWGLPFYPQSENMLSLVRKDPVKFLETEVFGRFPKQVKAVGFKVLYPPIYEDGWEPILTYLRDQKSLKVIHIKRKNILKSHLSVIQTQAKKDQYVNLSGAEEEKPSVSLDYENCLKVFESAQKWEKAYDVFFEDHDKIEVLYENISSNYENEMERIQNFLKVNCEAVKPLTHKQSKKPLSEAITNYFELKEKFKDTAWEEFFED